MLAGGLVERDEAIAAVARRQHGVITRRQLLTAGLGPGAIDRRVRRQWLHRLHRGVYLTGHPPASHDARGLAAVLACGRGADLSQLSAAALWQLLPDAVGSRPVDIAVPRRNPGVKPGIRLYRATALDQREVRVRGCTPLTSPPRTLLDLAASASGRELEQALAEAQRRRLASERELSTLLARHRGRPGTGPLRALLEAQATPGLTRSEAEERFLALVRAAGLPPPRTKVRLQGYEVDFLWPRERLVVESTATGFTPTQPHSSAIVDATPSSRPGAIG